MLYKVYLWKNSIEKMQNQKVHTQKRTHKQPDIQEQDKDVRKSHNQGLSNENIEEIKQEEFENDETNDKINEESKKTEVKMAENENADETEVEDSRYNADVKFDEKKSENNENDNVNDDVQEILSTSIKENALRIQKEFFNLEQKSEDYLIRIYNIIKSFETTLNYFQLSSSHLNYLLELFGYKSQSEIKNSNLFHYAAEALIIEIFKNISYKAYSQSDSQNQKGSFSFSDILREIVNYDINEKRFLQNLELITGTVNINDPAVKLTEIRLGRLITKNFISVKSYIIIENENLSKVDFEKKLKFIFDKTVELTINEIEVIENEIDSGKKENYVEYHQHFLDLKETNSDFNLEQFTNFIYDKHGNLTNACLLNSCEAYYYFASNPIEQLITDLESFVTKSNNVLYKIRSIFAKQGQKINLYYQLGSNKVKNILGGIKFKVDFSKNLDKAVNSIKLKRDNLVDNTKKGISLYRSWINDSIETRITPQYLQYKNYINSKLINIKENISIPLSVPTFEKVYSPFKNFTIKAKTNSVAFIFEKSGSIKKNITEFVASLKKISGEKYESVKGKLTFDYSSLVKFDSNEEEEQYVITISNAFFIRNKKAISNTVNKLIQSVNFSHAIDSISNKSREVKDSLYEKYQKFFKVAKNEEIKSQ